MNEMNGMSEKEEVLSLKGEVYDLGKTVNQQAGLIMAICESLDIPVADGVNPQDILDEIKKLKEDK